MMNSTKSNRKLNAMLSPVCHGCTKGRVSTTSQCNVAAWLLANERCRGYHNVAKHWHTWLILSIFNNSLSGKTNEWYSPALHRIQWQRPILMKTNPESLSDNAFTWHFIPFEWFCSQEDAQKQFKPVKQGKKIWAYQCINRLADIMVSVFDMMMMVKMRMSLMIGS